MAKESEFRNKMLEKIKKSGGFAEEDIFDNRLKRKKDEVRIGQPLSYEENLTPKAIENTRKIQKEIEKKELAPSLFTSDKNKLYDKSGNLVPVSSAVSGKEIDLNEMGKKFAQKVSEALASGDMEKAAEFQKKVDKISEMIEKTGPKFSKVTKALGIPLLSSAASLYSGDVPAAALNLAAAVDPTGASDLASEIYRRSKQSPEERVQQVKEDKYEHLAGKGIGDEAMQLQQLEDLPEKKQALQKSADPEAIKNMVKVLGGEPDVSPKKAATMVGEKPSKDVSGENYSTYENYIKEQKRKLGY